MTQKQNGQKTYAAKSTFGAVEQFLTETTNGTGEAVLAYRKTAFQRFPLLFSVLVVFGGATTAYGIQEFLAHYDFFSDHPLVTMCMGLLILGATGRLYKRLS